MSSSTPTGTELHFAGRRSAVFARRGLVASSQPLASHAGLTILMQGGTAADAAIATAAALAITEPGSTGIGGDCFALYYEARTGTVSALNGSGRSPAALDLEAVKRAGLFASDDQPMTKPYHALAITVPGAVAGWCDLLARFGSLPLRDVLAPAIHHATTGFPVAPLTAQAWARGAERQLRQARGAKALLLDGRAPRAGEIFRNADYGRALREIAEGGAPAFYRGPIARALTAAVQASGGVLTEADLAGHRSTWETPLSVEYRGHRIWECPPNGQGLTALLALNILKGFDLGALDPLSPERWHLVIEALRLAFADARYHIADPAHYAAPLEGLLSVSYAALQRSRIDPRKATVDPRRGSPTSSSGTVYLCVVDGAGNACSFINSNYMGFGTGIVPEGWGFPLQNRGHNFSLDPDHPNVVAPHKRPYHTIIPGLITRADGSLWGPFGVMGGFMQPQGHVQVASALFDDGLDPQSALDRLRFCIEPTVAGGAVSLEAGLPDALVHGLARFGHPLVPDLAGDARGLFGRGQVIERRSDGVLCGGSDPRADGLALGW
jgi:gamma-glutamyltranspeptidase/glutathione hydrolase